MSQSPETELSGSVASPVNERRRYILDEIRLSGSVSFEKLMGRYRDLKRQSIHQDVSVLKELGLQVEIVQDDSNRSHITRFSPDHFSTKSLREAQEKDKKQEIGYFAASLVRGVDTQSSLDLSPSIGCVPIDHILAQLQDFLKWPPADYLQLIIKSNAIMEYLCSYWGWDPINNRYNGTSKRHRLVTLDSGTTVQRIAIALKDLPLPDMITGMGGLRVLTNSPDILHILADSNNLIDVIAVGGRVRKDTSAMTGTLTQRILEQVVTFTSDISFVGTTNVNLANMTLGSDSEDESIGKTLMLANARLKCCVADSSKFSDHVVSSFPFASIAPSSIDILLTDHSVDGDVVKRLARRGVPCLRVPQRGKSSTVVPHTALPTGLIAISAHDNTSVREAAISALASLAKSEPDPRALAAVELLRTLSEHDKSDSVRQSASACLKSLPERLVGK